MPPSIGQTKGPYLTLVVVSRTLSPPELRFLTSSYKFVRLFLYSCKRKADGIFFFFSKTFSLQPGSQDLPLFFFALPTRRIFEVLSNLFS